MNSKPQDVSYPDASRADRDRIEKRCTELIDVLVHETSMIKESISYCVLGGGKRFRPVLCLWTHDFLNGAYRDACMDVACAIECLHTYSLVHDDLPCMDDDDLRRGKPSCHKKFGEAIAVLT
jgi:geranylgeranyl diphosphate synthase type II